MSDTIQADLAGDLQRVHRVATRAIQVSLDHAQQFSQGGFPDDATRSGYYNYVQCLSTLLHAHHSGEDEIAFPQLQIRMPTAPVDELCVDHEKMQVILNKINRLLDRVNAGERDAAILAELSHELDQLSKMWSSHIHLEEDVFSYKKVRQVFKDVEQLDLSQQMSEHSQKLASGNIQFMPFFLYNLAPEDRAVMERLMPPVLINELIPKVWRAQWSSMDPFLLV